MTIYVRDLKTSQAVRKLAKLRGVTLTEAIRDAVEDALTYDSLPKNERVMLKIKKLQMEIAKYPDTGLKADKAFLDELSGDM